MLALMAGCQDYEIKGNDDVIDDVNDNTAPDILVTPDLIDFGVVDATTGEVRSSTVTVQNIGDGPLEIHNLELENEEDEDSFSYSTIGSVLISPGSSTSFVASYEALTAEEREARILIDSNDPDEPQTRVRLLATGQAPVITVSPETYDFGTLYIGCETTIKTDGPLNQANFPISIASKRRMFPDSWGHSYVGGEVVS